MADHLIDDHFQPQFMRPHHQRVEIRQRAELRIDVTVVADVIAHIVHRRGEKRRQPDRINAQRGDMLQPRGDPRQIADAIAIAVLKTARIDLIDHRTTPPFRHIPPA